MKKKRIFVLLLISVLVLSIFLVGCGNGDNGDNGDNGAVGDNGDDENGGETPERVAVATGGTTGVYYPLGGAFANIINDYVDDVSANAESTGASVENANLLNDGDVDFALIQNDISYFAYQGEEMFDTPMDNLRGLATLYPETIQIVADAGAGIESIEDLVGKRVAVGAPGSGTEANARQILEVHGISYDDLTPDYLSFAEAADNLRDGNVDAAFVTAGTPTAAITDLSTQHNVVLIPIEQDMIDQIVNDYPYYTQVEIPGGTYRNQDDTVDAVAVMAMIAVRAELSEDFVYEITAALFENLSDLESAHARGGDVSLEGAQDGMSLELHPGAQRYFDEVQ
jgi:uncharacterized protein